MNPVHLFTRLTRNANPRLADLEEQRFRAVSPNMVFKATGDMAVDAEQPLGQYIDTVGN